MGNNNSSTCRVVPMMKYMMDHKDKLVDLLKDDIHIEGIEAEDIDEKNVYYGSKGKSKGEKGEKALKQPCEYLCELIKSLCENEYAQRKIRAQKVSDITKDRLEMIESQEKRDEAIGDIRKDYENLKGDEKKYYLLERCSKPDVFIETRDALIVIEGKWTEQTVTESTKYQKKRNQMVRHIHCALNYARRYSPNKKVYGFYIVPKDFKHIKEITIDGFKKTLKDQFGIENDKKEILRAYKEFVTWEEIEEEIEKNSPGVLEKYGYKSERLRK